MRVLNRIAVGITAKQPFIDWTRKHDADASKGQLTVRVASAKPYGTAILLPEFEVEEDVQEWIEANASWLFEFQLSSWTESESAWPQTRDFKTFREWFRIDIHATVVDDADDEIGGEEL